MSGKYAKWRSLVLRWQKLKRGKEEKPARVVGRTVNTYTSFVCAHESAGEEQKKRQSKHRSRMHPKKVTSAEEESSSEEESNLRKKSIPRKGDLADSHLLVLIGVCVRAFSSAPVLVDLPKPATETEYR